MKKSFLLPIFLLAVGWQLRAEMSLVVQPIADVAQITPFARIGKLVYSADSLYLYDAQRTLIYGEQLANVRHVRYSDEVPPIGVGSNQEKESDQIVIYPNPTADILFLEGVESAVIHLYTAKGELLQTIESHDMMAVVDMSAYPAGAYVLFCGNKAFSVIRR